MGGRVPPTVHWRFGFAQCIPDEHPIGQVGPIVGTPSNSDIRPWVIRSLLRCHVARQGGIWTLPQVAENASWMSVSNPPWEDLQKGALPRQHGLDDAEPGVKRHGWQFGASQKVDDCFLSGALWPGLSLPSRALLRSQGGPLAGLPFTCFPGTSPPSLEAPSSFFRSQLPVWPFSRFQWPPPRRGSGSQGLHSRECGGTRLQRSRSQSLTQHSRSRHGPGSSERFRQSLSGDRGRRLASVPRSSISSGHDSGFCQKGCAQKGWDTTPTMCHHGRCSS